METQEGQGSSEKEVESCCVVLWLSCLAIALVGLALRLYGLFFSCRALWLRLGVLSYLVISCPVLSCLAVFFYVFAFVHVYVCCLVCLCCCVCPSLSLPLSKSLTTSPLALMSITDGFSGALFSGNDFRYSTHGGGRDTRYTAHKHFLSSCGCVTVALWLSLIVLLPLSRLVFSCYFLFYDCLVIVLPSCDCLAWRSFLPSL